MARLVVINQSLASSFYELGEKWATIGRADGNVVQLVEESVSARHCEVQVRGEDLLVRDLLSTNGTFISGRKITEGVVKPGGTLRVGDVELRYESSAHGTLSGAPFTSKMLVGNLSTPKPTADAATVSEKRPEPAGNAGKQFHVLFVDDSRAFLESFGELCMAYSNRSWQVHTAVSADRALALLQQCLLDLVVLDIAMPGLDGLQLLSIIKRRYPSVKLAVMTGNATEGMRADALAKGAQIFLEKPITAGGLKLAFNVLNDLVSSQCEGLSGAFQQADLPEIIQMECIGGRSSIVEISHREMHGRIFIETGVITHAEAGGLSGEPAFHQLLSLKDGEVEVKPFVAPPRQSIDCRWEHLLKQTARPEDAETVMLTKPDAHPTEEGPSSEVSRSARKPGSGAESVDHGLGEQIVVAATYDGRLNQNDKSAKPKDDSQAEGSK